MLLRHLTGSLPAAGPGVSVPYGAVRAATDVLLKLPADAWDTAGQEVRDGWGRAMQYHDDGALGGGPLVRSRGPDNAWNTADDIRSDEAR